MIDVHLAGNLVVDTVYTINRYPTEGTSNTYRSQSQRVGGLGNMIPALVAAGLRVHVQGPVGSDADALFIEDSFFPFSHLATWDPRPEEGRTANALILASQVTSERTSFVEWGVGVSGACLDPEKAHWTHVGYLDVLEDVDLAMLRAFSGRLSADLCLSNPSQDQREKVLKALPYLDVLFMSGSESEAYCCENMVRCMPPAGAVVCHTPRETYLFTKKGSLRLWNPQLQATGLNVLGAGDIYAAHVIIGLLKDPEGLGGIVLEAHKQTTETLLRRAA